MKRLIVSTFLLAIGAGLGGGGYYVVTNWDQINPFRDRVDKVERFLVQIRQACTSDQPLQGAIIKSVRLTDGKLTLHGLVARADQIGLIQAKGTALLAEDEEFQERCSAGVSTDGLKVFAIHEHLVQLQRDFDEGRGTEKDADPTARAILRATRIDGLTVTEEGKLSVAAVCVQGNTKAEAADAVLAQSVKRRLEAMGVPAELVPEMTTKVQYFPNPTTILRQRLEKDPRSKEIHLTSAWYDAQGKLNVEGIVAQDAQRKLVEDAVSSLLLEPGSTVLAKSPGKPDAGPRFAVRLFTFASQANVPALQKKWAEHARKLNQPQLARVRIDNILPTVLLNEKKEIVTDDEGNPRYYFRVKSRLLETAGERKQIEKVLTDWLKQELPRVLNQNQTFLAPQLELDARPSPIFALQKRIVQRELDGAVFTDAYFDEAGRLILLGRFHQTDDEGKKALEEAIKDLLVPETPWSLGFLTPHQSTKFGLPMPWKIAVGLVQKKLAEGNTVSRRARVDRLYFDHEKSQLQLIGVGAFFTESAAEDPTGVLTRAIDEIVRSRGGALVSTSTFKRHPSPLADWQNQTTERPDLDGVLFTGVRYGPEGVLHVDGFLGLTGHAKILTPLLATKLEQMPGAVRPGSDPKAAPGWTLAEMKPHPADKGVWKWSDVLRACQAELTAPASPRDRRTCVERAFFKYGQGKSSDGVPTPKLVLHCKGTFLVRPLEKVKSNELTKKFDRAFKRLLTEARIDLVEAEVHQLPTPIFDLQKRSAELRQDGLFFQEAFFDQTGKLAFTGQLGDATQLKKAREMIEKLLGEKDKKSLAPAGVAELDQFKLVAWKPMLDELRAVFASDKAALFRQTRIDRAYFGYDETTAEPVLHFQGICIYQGKVPPQAEQVPALTNRLMGFLKAKEFAVPTLQLRAIERKPNPQIVLQSEANKREFDGVVFRAIGFDRDGKCYVELPFLPTGQSANVRKLIDEQTKNYPHLGAIQQR